MKNEDNVTKKAVDNNCISELITAHTKQLQDSINANLTGLTSSLSKKILKSIEPIKFDFSDILSKQIEEQLEITSTMQRLGDALNPSFEIQKQYQENIRKITQFAKDSLLESTKISSISFQVIARQLKFTHTVQLQESMRKITEYAKSSLFDATKISATLLQSIAEKYDFEEMDEGSEKEIIEATEIVSNIFNNGSNQTFEQKINCEIEEWKKKKPLKAKVLFWMFNIICVLIFNQIVSCAGNYIKDGFNTVKTSKVSEQGVKKDIKKEISGKFPEVQQYIYSSFKYINKDDVFINIKPKMNSFHINKLQKGDTITIINKNKRWIYISYENMDGEIIYGWINTIYLNRIY